MQILLHSVLTQNLRADLLEISVSLLFKFITNLFDPWEILTQEWVLSLFKDIILISTPYLPCKQQGATSKTGPIFVFPWIQPFGFDASSSLGRVYSRQATVWNCERSPVSFVLKYCPFSTTLRNPASLQNFTQFVLLWQLFISFSILLQQKIFVSQVITIQKHFCLDHAQHEWGTRLCSHNGSPRSFVKGFILFTHLCDCSVNTELVCRNNYAKNGLNRFLVGCKVYRQFTMSFAFELTSG